MLQCKCSEMRVLNHRSRHDPVLVSNPLLWDPRTFVANFLIFNFFLDMGVNRFFQESILEFGFLKL